MTIQLMKLPYPDDALAPHVSKETISFHYGKHHKTYVDKLNGFIQQQDLPSDLVELVKSQGPGPVFNNAAQVLNHNLYWESMSPTGGGDPSPQVADALDAAFGSVQEFRKQFDEKALTYFGSGWIWLVRDNGKLAIETTRDAGCPIKDGKDVILVCDLWEHAYYIDYRNDRKSYIESWWKVVNWEYAHENLQG